MSTPPFASGEPLAGTASRTSTVALTRPLYWSVRRELWEHRSVYIAPLVAAGLMLVGFLVSLLYLPDDVRSMAGMEPTEQAALLARPYSHAAMLLIITGFLVGIVYSLDALHSERRERSILFWKSLPVSDVTTILSKASIPLAVLPLIVLVLTVVTQLLMLLLSTLVLLVHGLSAAILWRELPLFQMEVVLLYAVVALTLWYAPVYAWLMLVSGWARRTVFLWAVLPLLAVTVLEGIALHTWHFGGLLKDRLVGFAADAFAFHAPDGATVDAHFVLLQQLTPVQYLRSPGLWLGLVAAAALLVAAVRLRRYSDPI